MKKFLWTCFNPELLFDVDEDEVEEMVDACWHEMTHGSDGVTLIEFVECALSSEVVDYESMRKAFNHNRKFTPMEKVFGDSVGSYKDKDKKVFYGLLPTPASGHDQADRARKLKQKMHLQAKMPGLGH